MSMICRRFRCILISSDGHDEIYNPDSQIKTDIDSFTRDYFDLDSDDLDKISTSTAHNSCLNLTSSNIRSV